MLRATLILPAGNFPGTTSNTLTLVGYRMLAHTWFAGAMTHDLESLQPDGAWFSHIDCYYGLADAAAALAAAGLA
jgi:hypothetical protein